MRTRLRNGGVFSMSAIDLFASAMGAFLVITIILMPDYQKEVRLEGHLKRVEEPGRGAARANVAQLLLESRKRLVHFFRCFFDLLVCHLISPYNGSSRLSQDRLHNTAAFAQIKD